MKKIKYSWLLLPFLVLISSCEKALEEDPYSYYSSNTFFKDINQATMAVMGIYEVLGQQDTYGRSLSMAYAIDSDIAQIEGTNFSGDHRTVAHYAATPIHPWLERTWRTLYNGVERANVAIDRIAKMELNETGTDAEKASLNRLLGEAHFLRGLIYFDLVRLWGDVPLKTNVTQAGDDFNLPRTDRELVYAQIVEDMEKAVPVIPWASQKPLDERVSKGAVKGILARVYLFRGGYALNQQGVMVRPENYRDYYEAAARETREIMESGEHSLNPSYEQVFKNYAEYKLEPRESMFEIAFFNAMGGSGNSGIIGTWNSPVTHQDSPYGRANSFYKTTPVFRNSYEDEDIRRTVAVATFKINADGSQEELTGNNDRQWAPGKWRRNWQGTAPKDPNNTDINWVLLRYADVLLMRAEAENELNDGPNDAAYDAIEEVRERAGLTEPLQRGLLKERFLEILQQERAHELCFEGWRKFDLIRWNIIGDRLREAQAELKVYRSNFPYIAGDQFVDNKHALYPIPQRERDQNPNLSQNPNY